MDKKVLQISFVLGVVIYALAAMLSIIMLVGGDPWYGIIWLIGAYPFVKIMSRLNNLIKFNGKQNE